jgi:DNA-binding PucR family transcriptional regulator
MRLREVLDLPNLRLALLCGTDEDLDRPVQRVYTTDLLDPTRYLSGDELVLTGLMWWQDPTSSEAFAANLANVGVAGIGAGEAALGLVPPDLIDACRRHGLVLFRVPVDVSFRSITEEVSQSLMSQRASGLAMLLGRQRGLVSAMARGARLADLLPSVAGELAVSCWVCSTTGRIIAGTGPLPPTVAERLTRTFLVADRLPCTTDIDGRDFLLLPVAGRPEHRLAAWCLVCETPMRSNSREAPFGVAPMHSGSREAPPTGAVQPPTRSEVTDELLSLVTLERAQLDQGRRAERRLAAQLMRALISPGEPSDLRAAMRACRLSPDATYLVATASVIDRAAGSAPAKLATYLLDELVRPLSAHTAVGRIRGAAMAVLTVKPEQAHDTIEALRTAAQSLAPGLRAERLAIGVSGAADGAAALPGAAIQARHTHFAASALTEPTAVISSADLASHVLLLASVGADARQSFRSRLLGPLIEYDQGHNADLIATLDTFLRCSGSWQRCAVEMHVHVNTLRYRLQRVEQLTGRDLSRFEDRVDFFLALRLLPS